MMRVLVLEDDPIIAFDLESQLGLAGFEVLGPALRVSDALRLIASAACDAAIVDVNLGQETAEPVALELGRREVPFIVVSGYPSEQHPPAFRGRPTLVKPYDMQALIGELRRIGAPCPG